MKLKMCGKEYDDMYKKARLDGVNINAILKKLPKDVTYEDVKTFIEDGVKSGEPSHVSIKTNKKITIELLEQYDKKIIDGFKPVGGSMMLNKGGLLLRRLNRRKIIKESMDINKVIRYWDNGKLQYHNLQNMYLKTFFGDKCGKRQVLNRKQTDNCVLDLTPLTLVNDNKVGFITKVTCLDDYINNCKFHSNSIKLFNIDIDKLLCDISVEKTIDIGIFNREVLNYVLTTDNVNNKGIPIGFIKRTKRFYLKAVNNVIPKHFRRVQNKGMGTNLMIDNYGYILRIDTRELPTFRGMAIDLKTTRGKRHIVNLTTLLKENTVVNDNSINYYSLFKGEDVIKRKKLYTKEFKYSLTKDEYMDELSVFDKQYIDEQYRLLTEVGYDVKLEKDETFPDCKYGKWELNFVFLHSVRKKPMFIPKDLRYINHDKVMPYIKNNYDKQSKLLEDNGYTVIPGTEDGEKLYINEKGFVFNEWLIRGSVIKHAHHIIHMKDNVINKINVLRTLYNMHVEKDCNYNCKLKEGDIADFKISDIIPIVNWRRKKGYVPNKSNNVSFNKTINDIKDLPIEGKMRLVEKIADTYDTDIQTILKKLKISVYTYNEFMDTV